MPYEVYKILHILAIAAMFAALGASVINPEQDRKLVAITHGTALVIVLVSGFGMLAKIGIHGFPGWIIGKLVLWLLFGGLLAVARKAPGAKLAVWTSLPLLAGVAAWLAVAKPF